MSNYLMDDVKIGDYDIFAGSTVVCLWRLAEICCLWRFVIIKIIVEIEGSMDACARSFPFFFTKWAWEF
jgi:hypothetical protein